MTEGDRAGGSPAGAAVMRGPDDAVLSEINADLERASDLALAGKREEALQLCQKILDRGNLPARSAASLSLIMRGLGQDKAADQIRAVVLEGIRSNLHLIGESIATLLPTAEALDDLQATEEAAALYRRAFELNGDDPRVVLALAAHLVQHGQSEEAVAITEAFCDRIGNQFDIVLHLSTFFAHFDENDAALLFLERARASCRTKAQRSKLNFRLAALGMPVAELDQHGMAVDLFDTFAENYDSRLTALGNNGPSLVFTALEELALPKTKTRRILDAGCGTGLCAGFLRDYASEIVGVDLSIKMLEKAREKRLYDFLARTDLSSPATYPEGTFDMIVCADVFVYFGALETVFQNFHRVLKPSGWLIATFEDESNPQVKSGFKLYSTGRHKHSDTYIADTLMRAGFPKPKLLEHGRLRNEMADAVLGTVVAVQKSALVFG